MRGMFYVALVAALASAPAGAADWSHFIGSNPSFPNQLAEHGLAVDAGGLIALQAYNRPAWSRQIEFIHEYTLAADGTTPWIWGVTGKGPSAAMTPHGVDQRDGHRLVRIERADDPWTSHDDFSVVPPNSSQPLWWFSEPQTGGHVVDTVSGGADGGFVLRALDAGAGFEVIAFDDSWPRWRTTVQPCAGGAAPGTLAIDYAPFGVWPAVHTLSVAGSCDDGVSPPQVFVQRFDSYDGSQAATEWLNPGPDHQLAKLAFSPAHELVAVYSTSWGFQEVHRVPAPGMPFTGPVGVLFGVDQVVALAPAGADTLVIVGADVNGNPVSSTVWPQGPVTPTVPLVGLAGFPGGGWTFAAGRDEKLLALRTETGGAAPLVRLVGLDAYGQLQWSDTIAGILPGAVPQAVPAKDAAGGFVVAVDRQDAGGTIGIEVRRIGSTP
ncbi:hypothetical protein [Tahibacter caeni]|uniref:hypothetical protein n=1 Tax=Tahibacter caeni TaxID=1453545 RepID=UPI0021473313|nr:hypothetical protein [Tahibacter caeni]